MPANPANVEGSVTGRTQVTGIDLLAEPEHLARLDVLPLDR